ncbi:MAG: glucosidase [Acidobacteria bacterium]|nr:glucosidase [Acidobacteriota bacterium]
MTRHVHALDAAKSAEVRRLFDAESGRVHWKRWGPYLSERAWGTVREDYSAGGDVWESFPHDHARSRAYRWTEDGLGGFCDRHQSVCFAVSLWNGRDPILKERLFGLNGNEGNHGEDVKECYFYLDATPTHSFERLLYKYPQTEFPYRGLVDGNRLRDRTQPELELLETGALDEERYFDVFVEYAKADVDDILIRIRAANRGPEKAELHVLPTVWFRNTWSWTSGAERPALWADGDGVALDHPRYGRRTLVGRQQADWLFTENDTNTERLYGYKSGRGFYKDGVGERVIRGRAEAVNPDRHGTKAAAWHQLQLEPGQEEIIELRLGPGAPGFDDFDAIFDQRGREAEEFYQQVIPADLSPEAAGVMRQSFAGLLWSKQYYHYVVRDWLRGDPAQPDPPESRKRGRNHDWTHVFTADVLSMPDKWEYPWFAAWDLAFHCVPMALIDSDFAKEQLMLLVREWYMHPNGQLPAYEWEFGDVNPPVHAWAAWRVYKIEKSRRGKGDFKFLERVFHKLLLNFTWWVNRKDAGGRNVFEGGFLGLDNIGAFDRSAPSPTGGRIEQADATGWMAMYCLNLLAIAMELARTDPAYEDVASKFWEHFLYIAYAIDHLGSDGVGMWDETDGFFYDVLSLPDGRLEPLKVRSMVGLIPLFAVETLEPRLLEKLPGFQHRLEWFIENRPDLTAHVACMRTPGSEERRLLSIADGDRLRRILAVMLDENEFLSPYGVRSLSKRHEKEPYVFRRNNAEYSVDYEPGESTTGLFGGNSNWRGPVWFPVNYLLIESLQRFHHYWGDGYKVECPTGSGNMLTLWQVAEELSRRLGRLFLRDADGRRPLHGAEERYRSDPHWRDLVLFYECFDGDNGRGVGASHQTGWTALVAKLMQQNGV